MKLLNWSMQDRVMKKIVHRRLRYVSLKLINSVFSACTFVDEKIKNAVHKFVRTSEIRETKIK